MRGNVRGERELLAAFDGLIEVFEDVRELPQGWQPNVDVRNEFEREWLDSEGGGEWADLSVGYAADKEAAVGNLPVEQYSRRMYLSLTVEGAPNFVREESASSLKVGTADPKARWHHEGAGNLPVRELIKKTEQEAQAQLLVFHNSYAESSRALGFRVI